MFLTGVFGRNIRAEKSVPQIRRSVQVIFLSK
ncbi:hypothetical protein OOU_Y34scaffold00773g9 [Pyricularia oryzae Y34]|uniref:Uncharacterized protein n=2 Tax=Pyricularia oryzae TaxID=318829 RepID=A0AA97NQ73_PYRO3|nr:hypothetical protein OOU_Y34scaffold00773g9 [Pyricularia oryzae Y34]